MKIPVNKIDLGNGQAGYVVEGLIFKNKPKESSIREEMTVVDPPEASRTYVFPNGRYEIKDVRKVLVRPSGTHRLEDTAGKLYIVNPGWMAIEIEAKDWTF